MRRPPAPARASRMAGAVVGLVAMTTGACAAEAPYPFEGTWILPQHACVAGSAHLRTYTAREVISPRGRCAIRRIAQGSGAFELQEECRHDGRASTVTETIRLTSPDTMMLKRQLVRLKIPRQIHYVRCTAAAPAVAPPAAPHAPGRTIVPAPAPDAPHRTP